MLRRRAVRSEEANMSMTFDTPQDSEALAVGFEALRTSAQLGRDLATVWAGVAEQIILLSVETNEAVIEIFRGRFGGSAIPVAATAWNWWAGTAAGLLDAYQETLQKPLAATALPARSENGPAAVELDLTDPAKVEVAARS
jgi:hypothetical protein